jgi:primosomal protein N' (replication factor Y) (superfamily II helicase)
VAPRYASVYPLVPSRAVARPFTYEVPPEVGKGSVVSLRFHGAKRRGVVVGLEEAVPVGIKAAPVGDVVDALPEPLVDLALWLADYYGSTPARALELVAPVKRRARGERESPVARDALGGEAEPAALSASQRSAIDRLTAAVDDHGGNFLL